MLFLLRQIRRKLLTNNKVMTYLLYAIGEIILVVVGILIAVSIDDWSDQKKLLNQKEAYIKRLIAENKQDLENFTQFKQEVEMAMATIDAFCEALKDETSSDSVILYTTEQYMMYGSLVPIFNSSRSTFDDLSNTGNLKVISDLSLRNQVVEHYAEVQRVQERMKVNSDWALSLDTRFYSETEGMKFTPWTSHLFPAQTTRERADELRKYKLDYINNASAGYWVDRDAVDLIEKLMMRTQKLIRALEAQIGISSSALPDPLAAGWNGEPVCEVLQENGTIRVLKCTFPPGVGHERHYHGPHVGYTLAGSLMRVTDTTGTREVQTTAGTSFASAGIEWHEVLNIGDETAEYLIIEYK
jgi:hypothetical protein